MSNFTILSSARSGSTSLAKILGESSDVKMAIEPFHPGFPQWNPGEKNYSEFIIDPGTMNQALDELFSKYTAIKVLDYQFPENIYFTMLNRKDIKVIFLRRKNLLEAAISNAVAHQTSEWHKTEKPELYDNLKPVNLSEISEGLTYVGEMNDLYLKFLESNRKGEYLPLFYEELYSEKFAENQQTIKDICDFLNISMPSDEAIRKHMTPSKAKINYQQIYKKIPNYTEIEKKFGAGS